MASEPGHLSDPAPAGGMWGRFYEGLGYLAGLILAIMAGAVFLQVVLRYMGWTGIDGLDEVPRYLFVWLVMLGAAAAMYRGEHTLLGYFRDRFGRRGRALDHRRECGGHRALRLLHQAERHPRSERALPNECEPRTTALLCLRRGAGGIRAHHPAHGAHPPPCTARSVAETLLIVFVFFI